MTGNLFIRSTFSNTFLTLNDNKNNVLFRLSSGCVTERTRRATYFAGIITGMEFSKRILSNYNINNVIITVRGIGPGRNAAIRGLKASGLKIKAIIDQTRIPHNGCRAKKKRRI